MKRSFKFNCIFALILLLSLNLFPGEKKAFTIDDLYRLKGISEPEISPDGRKVLLSVTEYNLKEGTSNNDIFLLNLADGKLLQLTYGKKSDDSPFWSSDGKKIYFISDREGSGQLWEMDAHGGEARKVSDFYTGISSPLYAAGTNKIFFASSVFPECLEKDECNECNKELDEKLTNGPVQAHLADSLLFRHWTAYRDWKYSHLFYLDPDKKKVQSITRGKFDYPVFSVDGDGFDISPDGKTLCVGSDHEKNAAHSTNCDLFLIDVTTPEPVPVNITGENKAYDGEPAFSPDGQWIAFIMQKVPGFESDKIRLAVYDLKNKQVKVLTEAIDNWVDDFQWAPDSRSVYFTLQEKGYTPLYRIDPKTGKVEKIIERQSIRGFRITPDGKQVIFRRSAVGEPYEIWGYLIGKKESLKRLTFFNKGVEDAVDIRPAEEHWTEGAEGKKIHIFMVKPHNFDPNKKYPLVLNIHGGPQMQWMDNFRGDWQVYPGAGYIVAFPNPHGSTGYGQAFTEAISGDYTGRVMEDVDKVTQYLAQLPYVDAERMGAMGWSWGGYAIMWLEGHNKHFKALVSMMGIYDNRTMYSSTEELWFPRWDYGGRPWEKPDEYRRDSPSSYTKNFKTPCLVITGERDYRVPYTQSLAFFTDLQEMGVPSRLIIFTNDGHWPNTVKSMSVYYNAHLEWFHTYLQGDKAPYDTEKFIRNLAFEEKKE
jgi:dipeptidyl aminopeptidase/acylaminoacyl peptidase